MYTITLALSSADGIESYSITTVPADALVPTKFIVNLHIVLSTHFYWLSEFLASFRDLIN